MDNTARYLQSHLGNVALNERPISIAKWDDFELKLRGEDFLELPDLKVFSQNFLAGFSLSLSAEQKIKLSRLFIQFGCEALMVFEQCFIYSSRRMRHFSWSDDDTNRAYRHFAKEEFYHSRVFKTYLSRETQFDFPKSSLVFHSAHRLKNIFAWILKKEPMAILLPGAKSEIFSLHLTQFFENSFPEASSSLTQLHKLHSADEVYHVGVDCEFVRKYLNNQGLIKKLSFVFFTFLMIFFIQWIVLIGTYDIAKQVLGDVGFLKNSHFTFRFFTWTLWSFTPYRKTKKALKGLYQKNREFYFRAVGMVSTL